MSTPFKPRHKMVLGITGIPGTGKSTVAELFGNCGAKIISADKIGHELLQSNSEIRREIIKYFGNGILNKKNEIDRRILGGMVFDDAAARCKLNDIVHPKLLQKLKGNINKQKKKKNAKIIVVDAALLFEWGIADWFDFIFVVSAPRKIIINRLAYKGFAEREVIKMIQSQWSQKLKEELADFVIVNTGSKAKLKKKLGRHFETLFNHNE